MTYRVEWVPSAVDSLALIWMATAEREAVVLAGHRIDTLLTTDPHRLGESREDGFRILIERPLTVYFEVIQDDLKVRVLRVFGR